MLKKIEIKEFRENNNPQYVKTSIVKARREDNLEIVWEVAQGHNSVHVLVDNVETQEVLLVKQIRIPVLLNDPKNNGIVYECCAGLVDKNELHVDEIACEEVIEELGYHPKNISKIRDIKTSVGISGGTAHLYFAEVSEKDKVSSGGGLHEEDIEVVRLKYDELQEFILNHDIHVDATTLFLLQKFCFDNLKLI